MDITLKISIHALLAESDGRWLWAACLRPAISIHALLAESDNCVVFPSASFFVFLSTLSLRRATDITAKVEDPARHFYPRSPCGERPGHRR